MPRCGLQRSEMHLARAILPAPPEAVADNLKDLSLEDAAVITVRGSTTLTTAGRHGGGAGPVCRVGRRAAMALSQRLGEAPQNAAQDGAAARAVTLENPGPAASSCQPTSRPTMTRAFISMARTSPQGTLASSRCNYGTQRCIRPPIAAAVSVPMAADLGLGLGWALGSRFWARSSSVTLLSTPPAWARPVWSPTPGRSARFAHVVVAPVLVATARKAEAAAAIGPLHGPHGGFSSTSFCLDVRVGALGV